MGAVTRAKSKGHDGGKSHLPLHELCVEPLFDEVDIAAELFVVFE